MRLYVVRHGAASETEGRCIGHCDVPLSAGGAAAIERLTTILPSRPDRIIASDLARAHQSADLLARHYRLPVARDPRLREMHFGEWEGVPWTELERLDGARLAAWMADWVRVRAPGGECFEDVVTRVQAWFDDARSAYHGQTVVVVAHAGAIRALCCLWLALPLDWAFRFRIEPAGMTVLTSGGGL